MDEPFDSPRFMIYKYHCKSVLHLSNDNLGLLFRTICEYQIDKDSLDKIDPRIAQVFPFFKNQFDLDDKKYQKKVDANRRNAQKNKKYKGQNNEWSPMESNGKVGNQKLPMVAEKGKDKDKVKDKDKDNILDINMANQRKVAGIEIQNIGNKEDLIDFWENKYSDTFKQDSKIREMYENKLAEFDD